MLRRVVFFFLAATIVWPNAAFAFCGFYVARAGASIFNKASQVVLTRDGDRTVITMASDYQGDVKDFAMVIPVPTLLKRDQIHIGNQATIDHLDAFTSPRLVEYFDASPCNQEFARRTRSGMKSAPAAPSSASREDRAQELGVKIEATYTVGEYDILILSAQQSTGLQTWLTENGYVMPAGAEAILNSYLKQGMKFFVAKVNLDEKAKAGFAHLRPLQMAYEDPKFMLPIRLGTVNAQGTQEVFVYALSRKGRIETTNYRTTKLPTDMDLPPYIKREFKPFYKDMFAEQVRKEGMKTVFLEYAWDMGWCDPCAADPLSAAQLRELGAFWVPKGTAQASDVYVTRLHVRYDAEHFPDDLRFKTTGNRENFQGRYVLRHPWKGEATACPEARNYLNSLAQRQEREIAALANLTGWDPNDIRRQVPGTRNDDNDGPPKKSWWNDMWE